MNDDKHGQESLLYNGSKKEIYRPLAVNAHKATE